MKKRTFVKLITLVLAVILLVATVGCAGTPAPTAPAAPAAPASAPAAPAAPATPAPVKIDYPKKAINIVIGFGAGGDTDLFARAMADGLTKELKVPVIVSNMTGGGASIASAYVKDSAPDGNTLFFTHNVLIGNYVCGVSDYSIEAFETACIIAKNDGIFLTLSPKKYKTLDDYIKYCKANPGKTTFGAVYGGSFHPLSLGVIDDLGLDVKLVDNGGAAPGNIEVAAGRIDAQVSTLISCKSFFQSGDLYPALACSETRRPEYPDVPTIKEVFGGTSAVTMKYSFYFPKGTDKAIIEIFNKAAEKVCLGPKFAELAKSFGTDPAFVGYGEARKEMDQIQNFYMKYKDIIQKK